MIRRGLTYRDLAQLAGVVPQRITNVLCYSDRTWPIRRTLNRVLRQRIFAKPPKQKPGPKKVKQYED